MWSNRIVIGALIAVIVIAAVDAFRSRDHHTTAPPTTAATPTRNVAPVRRCARGDVAVATIVVQNVRARRCLFSAPFHLTIRDRTGKMIGEWNDNPRRGLVWFTYYYSPGSEVTFSLPAVYRCDRPGPFVAAATVGSYSARRGNLSRRQITC